MAITDLATPPWRKELVPASFRDAYFHLESISRQSGRRVALHEFPKKNSPYAEDMGRRAMRFAVRAYLITYPKEILDGTGSDLYSRDYRTARDRLQNRLDDGKPGPFMIPNFRGLEQMPMPVTVKCEQYSITEDERFGGYCRFDILFVELGISPNQAVAATGNIARDAAAAATNATVANTLPDQTGRYIAPGASI